MNRKGKNMYKVNSLIENLSKSNFGYIQIDYRTLQVNKFTILVNGKYYQVRRVSADKALGDIPCIVFTRINSVIDYLENN